MTSKNEIAEYDQEIADMAAEQFLKEKGKEGIQFIPLQDVQEAQQEAIKAVSINQTERIDEAVEDIDITEFDITFLVKSDKIDKNILVTDLINWSRIAPEFRMEVAKELNSILGLNMNVSAVQQQVEQQAQQAQLEAPQREEQALVGANTRQGQGVGI